MSAPFEFLSPSDKPALIAITTPETLHLCRCVLEQSGYKVHTVASHEEFQLRFIQVQYQVLLMEECFAASKPEENLSLVHLQNMPMHLRRHVTTFLIGDQFQTLHAMKAFQLSVHAVLNRADLSNLGPVIQQTVSNNDLFLQAYRDTLTRMAQGKL